MPRSDIEQAERHGRRRANLLPVLAVMLMVQQGAFMAGAAGDGRRRWSPGWSG